MTTERRAFPRRHVLCLGDELVERAVRSEAGEIGEIQVSTLDEGERERPLGVERREPAPDGRSPGEAEEDGSLYIQLVETLGRERSQCRGSERLSRPRRRLRSTV